MRLRTWVAAGLAACAALAGSVIGAEAQSTQKLRFQASFPASSYSFENFRWWSDRVKLMSGGRLEIEVLPAGTLVPAFEVLDATHKGVIDGGHTAAAYWVGKHRAAALFGPSPGGPLGMDIVDLYGWLFEADGLALWKELYQVELKRNVIPIPMTAVNNQILGWFKTPVKSWEDLKGRKCRQTGLTAEVFAKAGLSPVNMPGGEIVPAGERGVIECGEWVGPAEDMKVGFHTVWKYAYMPSTHEPATVLELLVNGDTYNKLPADIRAIMETAAYEATYRHFAFLNRLNADAIIELTTKHGVKIEKTPDDILKKILIAWDEIAEAESAKSPFFKKVYDSQKAYAGKIVPARRAVQPSYNMIADHYWPEKK
jgi:TRAP-type mannitol/chloroaromatic compound transport system substrate-binding protein